MGVIEIGGFREHFADICWVGARSGVRVHSTPCPKTFGGFDPAKHWSWGDICPDRYQDGWVMGVLFRGIKQDPRCERPTARGGDWAVVGDVPGSIFSIMRWYKRLVQLGGVRVATEPFGQRSVAERLPAEWNRRVRAGARSGQPLEIP